MSVVVIDYGMGNLHSVAKALETVGVDVEVTSDPSRLSHAEKIVLPGVGSFAQGMKHLHQLGFEKALYDEVITRKKPLLGICLGMQLAARTGEEHGPTLGLNWFDANVVALSKSSHEVKIPHMGWNDVTILQANPLFQGLKSPTTFYFVHSYHVVPADPNVVVARCNHGESFAAAISFGNIHLVQFHPEKSQTKGLKVLENFCAL